MTWTGQRRPRGGPPRRVPDPTHAHWLQTPAGELWMTAEAFSAETIAEYNRLWDRHEAEQRRVAAQARTAQLAREDEARLHRMRMEQARASAEAAHDRVMAQLSAAPAHFGEWWSKLETWLERHPPKTYRGSQGDNERWLSTMDWKPETYAPRRKRGRPKGVPLTEEQRAELSRIRKEREAEGTWGHRTPALRKQFPTKSYEDLAREAVSDDD